MKIQSSCYKYIFECEDVTYLKIIKFFKGLQSYYLSLTINVELIVCIVKQI